MERKSARFSTWRLNAIRAVYNTFCCVDVSLALKLIVADFCIFQFIGVIGDIVIGFKSLALDGTVGLYTYIF